MSFTRLYATEFYRLKSTIIEIYVTEYHFSESETQMLIYNVVQYWFTNFFHNYLLAMWKCRIFVLTIL